MNRSRSSFLAIALLAVASMGVHKNALICPNTAPNPPADKAGDDDTPVNEGIDLHDFTEQHANPKIVVGVKGNRQIAVCGFESKENSKGRTRRLSEFDVYVVDANGGFSKSLKQVGSLENYNVYAVADGLGFDELTWYRESWVPIFRSSITCPGAVKACSFSKEICVFEKRSPGSTIPLQELKTYVGGKNKDNVPDESLIAKVEDLALSGESEAAGLFLQDDPPFKLDGAAGEEFDAAKRLIQRLKNAKCL